MSVTSTSFKKKILELYTKSNRKDFESFVKEHEEEIQAGFELPEYLVCLNVIELGEELQEATPEYRKRLAAWSELDRQGDNF